MSQRIGEDNDAVNGAITAATLSAIAYCSNAASITKSLADNLPDWTLVWEPDFELNGNYAYIAYNSRAQQYAVAIRGSVLNFSWETFQDWFEQDFNVFYQADWIYPPSQEKPKISLGARDGLSDLENLKDKGVPMRDFLMQNAVAKNKSIAITGHSLGAGLVTVFAPWLHYQITSAGKVVPFMPVMTFAAPAVGNQQFADAYNKTFPNSWRYYNSQDIVPMASASIDSMGYLYSPAPEANQIGTTYDGFHVTFQEAIFALAATIGGFGASYAQTNNASGSVELNQAGKLFNVNATDPLEQWFEQAGAQHSLSYAYLPFLGGKPFVCPS